MRVAVIALPYQVQIVSDSGRYLTCRAKQMDGEWYFWFNQQWHKVDDYTDSSTRTTKF